MCPTWDIGMSDELGQIAQGNKKNNIKGKAQTLCILFA